MEQRLEENNIKNENNRKKEYLRGYRSSRRRINRIDDEIIEQCPETSSYTAHEQRTSED